MRRFRLAACKACVKPRVGSRSLRSLSVGREPAVSYSLSGFCSPGQVPVVLAKAARSL